MLDLERVDLLRLTQVVEAVGTSHRADKTVWWGWAQMVDLEI